MKVGVVAGLVAATIMGATIAVAGPSAATQFELVLTGGHEAVPATPAFPFGVRHTGSFTASPPFCTAGTFADLTNDLLRSSTDTRLYTCKDGSGTITTEQEDWFEHKPPFTDVWRISSGSGRYADLRGYGSFRGEFLSGDEFDPVTILFRSTMRGSVAFDAVAPRVTVSEAKATKRAHPVGTYSIRIAFSMRDSAAQDRLEWLVAVEPAGGGLYLARKDGAATTGRVATTLRAKPESGARRVKLHVRAEDAVGNWRWVTRSLKLPR